MERKEFRPKTHKMLSEIMNTYYINIKSKKALFLVCYPNGANWQPKHIIQNSDQRWHFCPRNKKWFSNPGQSQIKFCQASIPAICRHLVRPLTRLNCGLQPFSNPSMIFFRRFWPKQQFFYLFTADLTEEKDIGQKDTFFPSSCAKSNIFCYLIPSLLLGW